MHLIGKKARYTRVMAIVTMLYISAFVSGAIKAAVPAAVTGAASAVPEGMARIVVFRLVMADETEADAGAKIPVNLYFNGAYHGSLLPDTRSIELLSCAGAGDLLVRPAAPVEGDDAAPVEGTEQLSLEAGVTYYYQSAIDAEGGAQIRRVDEARARALVESLPSQAHTKSRVITGKCPRE